MKLPDNTLGPNKQPRSVAPLIVGRCYVCPGQGGPPTGFFSCLRSRDEALGILGVMVADPAAELDKLLNDGSLVEIHNDTVVQTTGRHMPGAGWRSRRACARGQMRVGDLDPDDLDLLFRQSVIYVKKNPHTT